MGRCEHALFEALRVGQLSVMRWSDQTDRQMTQRRDRSQHKTNPRHVPLESTLPATLPFVTCDVFTDQPFAGNPLAIVLNADSLSDAAMQTMAREFNLSETIFVQTPDNPANTAKVRIFFPTSEIPFAGHPTIGCAIHLATDAFPTGDFETEIRLEEVAGLVPVAVMRKDGKITAELTAPVVPHGVPNARTADEEVMAKAIGLDVSDLQFQGHHPGVWQGGPRFAYVPVQHRDALARSHPCEPAWTDMMQVCDVDSVYVYTAGRDADYQGRMFSPTTGIFEDPATGSASCILAAQLHAAGALPEGETCLTLHQGIEMRRPSTLHLKIDVHDNAVVRVRLAGTSSAISQGEIRVPNL